MSVPIPSEAAQLAFLHNLQRLPEEGQFAATYKFALLVALVDIAIERGRDDGRSQGWSNRTASGGGVLFGLRRFSGFLRTLAQHGWLNEIRRNPKNAYLVGSRESLEEFLFGAERVPLGVVCEILRPMQDGRCFYCCERMNAGLHVDHFVPFALHPANLGHNLVLAHAACNSDKSDLLADLPHLDRWASRNEIRGAELSAAMVSRGIVSDLDSTMGIARWAYARAREAEAALWTRRGETRPFPRGTALSI